MLTIPRRQFGSLALTALALLVLPAVADAQLLPHLPIRRQRPDCSQEPPIFHQTRQMYYGYYPTCWRKFPPGWGCPTAERVDIEGLKREVQTAVEKELANPPVEGGLPDNNLGNPDEGAGPPPDTMAPPEESVTPVPSRDDRSPFNLDDGGRRRVNPASPRGTPAPSGEPVTPPATTPGSGPAGGNPGLDAPAAGLSESGAPLTLLDVGNPSSPVAVPSAEMASRNDDLPFPAPPAASNPGPVPPSAPAAAAPAMPPGSYVPAPVIQAPQRRRMIGGLFQNLNWMRR